MKKSVELLVFIQLALLLSPGVLAQQQDRLDSLFTNKKYEEAIQLGLKYLEKNPDAPRVNMIVGRSYADIKQFEKAIPYLEKGATGSRDERWISAWCHAYLGRCYYVLDQQKKSKENLQACINLKATENATRTALKWLGNYQLSDFYDGWEITETENIRFHFQNANGIVNREKFVADRQIAYQVINEFFKAIPYKKIDFYVWDDPALASEKLGKPLGFSVSDLCLINSRNDQTRGHEIAHILTAFGISPVKSTKLINEGVAVYFDQTDKNRYHAVKQLLDGKDLNVADLWENPDNYPEDYSYAVGGALIAFLFEKGTDKQLKDLLKDQRIDSARNVYGQLDNLLVEFTERIRK